MLAFCRTCFRQTCDNTEDFYRHKLMFCVPEIDLRELPDAKLCKDCAATIDVFYQFKIKCREIEHQVYKQHFNVIKEEIRWNDEFHGVCRTCFVDVTDGRFISPTDESFYNYKLMICVPQTDLRIIPEIFLCKNCHMVLDTLSKFKIKCLDVEKNMKEYRKLYSIVDFTDLSIWYNTSIKNENNVKDFTIKQEDVDLADEKEIVENLYDPNVYEQSFKCFQCEYSTARKCNLKQHMYTHNGEKPYKCLQCGYSAARKGDLNVHIMRIHIDEKPFKCSQCGYSAACKGDLKRHIHIHSGKNHLSVRSVNTVLHVKAV